MADNEDDLVDYDEDEVRCDKEDRSVARDGSHGETMTLGTFGKDPPG